MENNQHAFLATVRNALGRSTPQMPPDLFGSQPADLDKKLHAYLNKSKSEKKDLLKLYIEQAEDAHIKVSLQKNIEEAALSIRQLVKTTEPEWGDKKSVIAWHHTLIDALRLEDALKNDPVNFYVTKGSNTPEELERNTIRDRLIQSYIGITSADFCVAQTATLVMRTRPNQPRAVSLVPSIHIAVISADQIVKDLKELYFRLKWDKKELESGLSNCMTFISGPSKTADIELQMVFGAHGPKQLYVYVITGV